MNDRARWVGRAEALLAAEPGRHDLALLSVTLRWGRGARVAVVGRARSGRSTLLEGLGGKDRHRVGEVGWCRLGPGLLGAELPGFRAAGVPAAARRGLIEDWMRTVRPEGMVFTIPASEVDAGVDDDLDDLGRAVSAAGGPRVWAAATRVDELSPPEVGAPFEDVEKLEAIARSGEVLAAHGARKGLRFAGIFPMDARAGWGVGPLGDALWEGLREPEGPAARSELAALWKRVGLKAQEAARPWDDPGLVRDLARVVP